MSSRIGVEVQVALTLRALGGLTTEEIQALMLLRRAARFDDGELVLLGDQNRSRWDAAAITRGRAALNRAIAVAEAEGAAAGLALAARASVCPKAADGGVG